MTRHRGPHPDDPKLFGPGQVATLALAASELSWLLGRGYKVPSAIALVGNRHSLHARQRLAVQRAACSEKERAARAERRIGEPDGLRDRRVLIDGFNVVIALEAALSGGVLIIGRDGVTRDMASVHGSYRRVEETERAIELIVELLEVAGAQEAVVYLDRPVSNSGRLAGIIRRLAAGRVATTVELASDPDRRLIHEGAASDDIVCSGDGVVLDGCGAWFDLPAAVIGHGGLEPWSIDLRA